MNQSLFILFHLLTFSLRSFDCFIIRWFIIMNVTALPDGINYDLPKYWLVPKTKSIRTGVNEVVFLGGGSSVVTAHGCRWQHLMLICGVVILPEGLCYPLYPNIYSYTYESFMSVILFDDARPCLGTYYSAPMVDYINLTKPFGIGLIDSSNKLSAKQKESHLSMKCWTHNLIAQSRAVYQYKSCILLE